MTINKRKIRPARYDRSGGTKFCWIYIPLVIATRQQISEKYLEIILKVLVKNKLLEGQRGKGGGYRPDPSD